MVLLLRLGRKKPADTTVLPAPQANVAEVQPSAPSTNAVVPSVPRTTSSQAPAVSVANTNREGDDARVNEVLSQYNNEPIDFYGKLQDQFGNPVADAAVKGSIRVRSGQRDGTDSLTATSNEEGLFEFHGTGQDISMMPSKKGYALASLNGGGDYSLLAPEKDRAHPDPANPVVIKMWKLQGAQALLSINQKFSIPYTSLPVHIDLLSGTIVPYGGDLQITVQRPNGEISGRDKQDWAVQIDAESGGLLSSEGQDAITYEAPESGYAPDMLFTMTTKSNSWFMAVHQGFFITSRDHQVFGKLHFGFHINGEPNEPMTASFEGVLNTNASRNLEAAPGNYSNLSN